MPESLKFIGKANVMFKRDYSFRIIIMEEVFQIRSCIEMDDIKSTQLMVQ